MAKYPLLFYPLLSCFSVALDVGFTYEPNDLTAVVGKRGCDISILLELMWPSWEYLWEISAKTVFHVLQYQHTECVAFFEFISRYICL